MSRDLEKMNEYQLDSKAYEKWKESDWAGMKEVAEEALRRKNGGKTTTDGYSKAIYTAWFQDDWERVVHLTTKAMEHEKIEQGQKEEEKRLLELGRKVDAFRKAGVEVVAKVYTNPAGVERHENGDDFYASARPGQGYFSFTEVVDVDPERTFENVNQYNNVIYIHSW